MQEDNQQQTGFPQARNRQLTQNPRQERKAEACREADRVHNDEREHQATDQQDRRRR